MNEFPFEFFTKFFPRLFSFSRRGGAVSSLYMKNLVKYISMSPEITI